MHSSSTPKTLKDNGKKANNEKEVSKGKECRYECKKEEKNI